METKLSAEKERFVRQTFVCNALLALGALVIIVVFLVTVEHLRDQTVLWATVPGILTGLLLIGLHIVAERRIRERRLVASVLKKLHADI